ncbi:hypothetical protein GCM10027185_45580 [Spirosoma pulveris]
MLIYFTSIDPHGGLRTCCWYVGSLGFGLDALNRILRKGYHLLEAQLMDEQGRRTILPIDAFDGTPISPALQALEQEICEILGSPLYTPWSSTAKKLKKTRS